MTKRFLICALMTLLSAGVSAGFSLAGLLGPGRYDSFARYAASRSVALLLTILIAIGIRSRVAIAFLGIAMTVDKRLTASSARSPTILRKATDRLLLLSSTHSRWAGSCEGRRGTQTKLSHSSDSEGSHAVGTCPAAF